MSQTIKHCSARLHWQFASAAALLLTGCMTAVSDPDAEFDADQSTASPEAGVAPSPHTCSGPPFGQGSCGENEICGSLPNVGHNYCLSRVPCHDGMVEIMGLVCAFPCSDAAQCRGHRGGKCAPNPFAALSGQAPGWCTP
jgi:hypothetical protein